MSLQQIGVVVAVPDGLPPDRVGTLPPPLRLVRQLHAAGVGRPTILAVGSAEAARRWKARMSAEGATAVALEGLGDAVAAADASRRWLCVAGDLVVSGEGLREALGNGAGSGRTILPDGQPAWDTTPAGGNGVLAWARAVCMGKPAPSSGPVAHVLPPQRYAGRASDPEAARRLDAAVLENLGHRQDPNFPRLTGRRISRAMSRRLAAAGVAPNAVTLGGIAAGVLAAVAFAQASYPWLLVGALLLVFSRLLDDCDGEVARMTVRSTRLGARLDVVGDVVVYAAVFTGLAVGLLRSDPHGGHLWTLGLLLFGAGMTTAIVLGAVTGTSLPQHSRLLKFLETGASGDFAYVFLPFALLDAVDVFFWGAAIGAQVYWALLAVVVLRLRRGVA